MVSPELLRRYPFFGFLDDAQLRNLAMLASEAAALPGWTLFTGGAPAEAFYFLLTGGIELLHVVTDPISGGQREFVVGEVNPGDMFGISALIEPYRYTVAAKVTRESHLLRIDAIALRQLCDADVRLAYGFMERTARAAMERLEEARVLLAATTA